MRVAVLGTGVVGRTLAGKLASLGHEVAVGTRSPEQTAARPEWTGAGLTLTSFADAASGAELVVNASNGEATLTVLAAAGDLAGKVVLDVANPLDFSQGFPPALFVSGRDSLAETIQRAFPAARVVKTLNTVTAEVMVDPAGVDGTIFVAGDDADARALVTEVLRSFGWDDVLDLGDLSGARAVEQYLPLWVRLYGTLGTARFNVKVVR